MRLAHLLSQGRHDLAMRVLDDELLESSFVIPSGEGPELALENMRQQRVARRPGVCLSWA